MIYYNTTLSVKLQARKMMVAQFKCTESQQTTNEELKKNNMGKILADKDSQGKYNTVFHTIYLAACEQYIQQHRIG